MTRQRHESRDVESSGISTGYLRMPASPRQRQRMLGPSLATKGSRKICVAPVRQRRPPAARGADRVRAMRARASGRDAALVFGGEQGERVGGRLLPDEDRDREHAGGRIARPVRREAAGLIEPGAGIMRDEIRAARIPSAVKLSVAAGNLAMAPRGPIRRHKNRSAREADFGRAGKAERAGSSARSRFRRREGRSRSRTSPGCRQEHRRWRGEAALRSPARSPPSRRT